MRLGRCWSERRRAEGAALDAAAVGADGADALRGTAEIQRATGDVEPGVRPAEGAAAGDGEQAILEVQRAAVGAGAAEREAAGAGLGEAEPCAVVADRATDGEGRVGDVDRRLDDDREVNTLALTFINQMANAVAQLCE